MTLVVANDVVVEGRVVIKAGAPAKGEVTRSEARGIAGKPDRIAISIQSVTAADGAMIPVSATKSAEGEDKVVITIVLALLCLPLIFMKGGEAAIGAGSTINAATNGIAEVKVAVAGEPAASPAVEDATAVAGAQPLEAIE